MTVLWLLRMVTCRTPLVLHATRHRSNVDLYSTCQFIQVTLPHPAILRTRMRLVSRAETYLASLAYRFPGLMPNTCLNMSSAVLRRAGNLMANLANMLSRWSTMVRAVEEIRILFYLSSIVDTKVIPIWNTMAAIPGHIKDEVVVIGCHRDGRWFFGRKYMC